MCLKILGLILTVFTPFFLPSGQGRESDSLDFIYVQPESAEIFVSNLLNLSRANLNKSAALNMQCLYY